MRCQTARRIGSGVRYPWREPSCPGENDAAPDAMQWHTLSNPGVPACQGGESGTISSETSRITRSKRRVPPANQAWATRAAPKWHGCQRPAGTVLPAARPFCWARQCHGDLTGQAGLPIGCVLSNMCQPGRSFRIKANKTAAVIYYHTARAWKEACQHTAPGNGISAHLM